MYKRQIDDIEKIKPIEIYGSSKKGAYFSLNSFLDFEKPFNGMYINKNKVIVSNVFESITLSEKEYNIQNITTITDKITNKEYICEINLDNMEYTYRCQNVTYVKKLYFIENTDILVMEYNISNENDQDIKFNVIPLVTYRDMLVMKKANILKFSNREINDGILINLSIVDNVSLSIKAPDLKFIKLDTYVNNVKHECVNLSLKKDVYIEDIYYPGKFELRVKEHSSKNIKLYISTSSIDIEKYKDYTVKNVENDVKIDEEFVELKKLKKSLDFLQDINLSSLPSQTNLDNLLKNINEQNYIQIINLLMYYIRSIDGMYICLDKLGEAVSNLKKYIQIINKLEGISKDNMEFFKLKLWTTEIINKLFNKEESLVIKELKDFIGKCVIDIQETLKSNCYEVVKNVEVVALMYNTLKIYEYIFKDPTYAEIAEDMTECITKNFWDEKRRVLKRNVDDLESCACIEMLYAISLSYSVATKDIQIKLLDTIFRELYTPYGIRIFSKTSSRTDGLVYPKYMAYFIDANLNQNGRSYASKKIAYNLVKELFLDIGKYVKDSIIYAYSEKGISIDSKVLDLYTISEMIRLYTMFM